MPCGRCGKPALGVFQGPCGKRVLGVFHRSGSVHGPAAAAMIRERVEALLLLLDPRGERKGIEGGVQACQRRHLGRVGGRTGADAIQRGLRWAIDAADPAADARLLDELHRGQPQILQQPQIRIQRVERGQGGQRVIA